MSSGQRQFSPTPKQQGPPQGVDLAKEAFELRRTLEETVKRLGICTMENERLVMELQESRSSSVKLQTMTAEITTLRTEVTRIQGDLTRRVTECNNYQSEVNQLKVQISQLTSQIKNLTSQTQQDNIRLEQMKEFQIEKIRLVNEINSLKTKQSSSEDFQNDLTLLASENERLNAQLEQLQLKVKNHPGLESQIVSLNRTIEEIRRAEGNYRSEINSKNQQIEAMRRDLSQRDSTISQLDQKIANLTRQMGSYSQVEEALKTMRTNFDGAKAEVVKLQAEISSLQNQLRAANAHQGQAQKLQSEISVLTSKLNSTENDIRRLRDIEREFTGTKSTISQLQNTISTLQEQLRKAQQSAQNEAVLNSRITQLTQQLNQAQADLGRAITENQQLRQSVGQVDSLNVQTRNLNQEIQRLKSQLDGMNGEINRLMQENAGLRSASGQVQQLNGQVSQLNGEKQRLNQELNSLRQVSGQVQQLRNDIQRLQSENNSYRQASGQAEQTRAEINKLQNDISMLKQASVQSEQTSLEIQRLQTENDSLRQASAQVVQMKAEIQNLQTEIAALKDRNAGGEQQLRAEIERLTLANRQIPTLEEQISKMTEEMQRLHLEADKVARLSADLDRQSKDYQQLGDLTDQINRLTQENSALKESNKMTSEVERITQEKARLSQELEALRSTMSFEIESLRKRNEESENEIAKRKAAMSGTQDQLTAEVSRLQEEILRLTTEGDHQSKTAQKWENKYNTLFAEFETRRSSQTGDAGQMQARLQADLDAERARVRELQLEAESLLHTIEELKQRPVASAPKGPGYSNNTLADQLRLLLVENERLMAKIGVLEGEISDYKKVQKHRDELQNDIGALRTANKRLEGRETDLVRQIEALKVIVADLTEEIRLKVRIIDEKTFMLVDVEKELEKERSGGEHVMKYFRELDSHKLLIKSLEEDLDKVRLENVKLKEEFLFKNQTEEAMAALKKNLDEEKEVSMTKDTRIKDLEDKLSMVNHSISGLPLLNVNNQSLKDEVFKLQNLNQEKDLLLFKMKEVTAEMHTEIETIPELKLALHNLSAEKDRMRHLLDQKDSILNDFEGKLDILKESLGQILILEEKIKYLEEENVRLNKGLNDREGHVGVFQQNISELQRANQRIPELTHEIKFLKDELDRARKQTKDKELLVEGERDRFKNYIEDVQAQAASHLRQIGELEKLLRESRIKEMQVMNDHAAVVNNLQNKIRELVLAITHLRDETQMQDDQLKTARAKLQEQENDLMGLLIIRKERDTALNELERAKNDKRMLANVIANAEEKNTRLEASVSRVKIVENENNHLKEENRALENKLRDMILQREKINNDVSMTIDKGKAGVYIMQTSVDELKSQVKQLNDVTIYKDREIAMLKAQVEDLMAKLKRADLFYHELQAKYDTLDHEYKKSQNLLCERDQQLANALKEIELFKQGPGVYGKAYGYINYEKEYNITKLLLEQVQIELEGRSKQFEQLKTEYDRLAKKLPEFEEMKVTTEGLRVQNQDLQKDNQCKAVYISGIQMKLVVAMAEIERLHREGRPVA